tara:strand:- start:151 stop:1755 length:1605 start_codon:yes stop_codon:yes gene_type:complete
MKNLENKKKILFSWIDSKKDLSSKKYAGSHKDPRNSSIFNGPTLQLLSLESFDHVHLFHIMKDQDEIKARGVIDVIKVHSRDFKGKPSLDIHGIKVLHPADYNNMWIEVPKKTKEILAGYKNQNMQVYFNVSSGSAAMTSTWLFMKGTEDVDAEIISPQIDKAKNRKPYLQNIDLGTYPHVSKIKDKIQKTLGISHEFKSEEMKFIFSQLILLSQSPNLKKFPILLTGETGTGKTTIAQRFHEMIKKGKTDKIPFKKVLCGEFRGQDHNIAYSTLFGHKKGAYSGADNDYIGMIKEADGGIVFLDEIADIPMETQNILLDVIEGKPFRPLKSNDEVTSEFQLICATNKNIDELVTKNILRDDFVARLEVFKYEVPPLRQRPEDIGVILEGILKSSQFENLEIEEIAKKQLLSLLKKSSLKRNIRDITSTLSKLYLISLGPPAHALTISEVSNFFEKNKEPTQDDEFTESIRQSLLIWPNTSFAENGDKLKESFLEVAVDKLSERPDFRKKDGELNIFKISKMLGIDPKTVKDRL